jgi:hypothetical protein
MFLRVISVFIYLKPEPHIKHSEEIMSRGTGMLNYKDKIHQTLSLYPHPYNLIAIHQNIAIVIRTDSRLYPGIEGVNFYITPYQGKLGPKMKTRYEIPD